MYTCDSQECPIAQQRRADEEERARRQATAREANQKEYISAEQFRSTRCEARMTLKEAADLAGVTPAELSAYESEREPFPPGIYRGVMTEFLNRRIVEPSEDRYNHTRTLRFFADKRGQVKTSTGSKRPVTLFAGRSEEKGSSPGVQHPAADTKPTVP